MDIEMSTTASNENGQNTDKRTLISTISSEMYATAASNDNGQHTATKHRKTLLKLLLLDPTPSNATRRFIQALQDRLPGILLEKINKEDLDADENTSEKVLIICCNHTRIKSVLQPLGELKRDKSQQMLLVLFQCEKKNTFKKEDLSFMKRDYPQIHILVQMGFDNECTSNGIYDCKFNNAATKTIKVFAGEEEEDKLGLSQPTEDHSLPTLPHTESIKAIIPTSAKPVQTRSKIDVSAVDPTSERATKDILPALKDLMEQHSISLVKYSVQQLNEEDDDGKLVFVVCNNFPDDIKNALSYVQPARYSRIILFSVHCKQVKHPSPHTTQSQTTNFVELKELHTVLDIEFDAVRGIYDSDINKKTFNFIRDIADRGLFSNTLIENDESLRKHVKVIDARTIGLPESETSLTLDSQ